MSFSEELLRLTESNRMLQHPFYQAWEAGELDLDTLRKYARQYYHHVKAFPRYISATHSLCEDISSRQVLLDNLDDEEHGEHNHPRLWLDFAVGVGNDEIQVEAEPLLSETEELMRTFFDIARSSYVEGLSALYIYEQQIPAICETKIEGLKNCYGIDDAKTLEYFRLHGEVDIEHSAATAALVNELPEEEKEKAREAAVRASKALWGFLDGMEQVRQEMIH